MSSSQILDLVIAVALVAWIMVRQVQPRPVVARQLLVVPLVLAVIGATQVSHAAPHGGSLTSAEMGWLAVDLAVSVVSGAVRALSVRLFDRDGELWRQGSALTIVLWLASIAARALVAVVGGHHGAGRVLDDGVLLSFGVSLGAQYALILFRGQRSGIPFALRQGGGNRLGRL